MPNILHDLTGEQIGRLLVLHRASVPGKPQWICRCSCGRVKPIRAVCLVRDRPTSSCGCLARELSRSRALRHGMRGTATYASWNAMKDRCLNRRSKDYRRYGARGITVCIRWMLFENFYADMGPRPEGTTLERKNNNRGYCRSNCIWDTPQGQANNRRSSLLITYQGISRTAAEWDRHLIRRVGTTAKRHSKGWSVQENLTIPVNPNLNRY